MSATLDFHDWATQAADDAASPARPQRPAWMAAIAVLGGLLAGSSAFALSGLRTEPLTHVAVSVGGTSLAVPVELLRTPGTLPSGAQPRVDLRLSWPDLGPVRSGREPLRPVLAAGAGSALPVDEVQVSILPADDGPAPETRVSQLYARFLEPQVQQGPGELLSRHFKRNSPYSGEILVFSPPDGRRVAARCESEPGHGDPTVPAGREAEIAPTCLAEFRRRGLDVQLRFEPRLAGGLEPVQRRLASLLDRMAR